VKFVCYITKNNIPSFLYHSHYQQRAKHRHFSALPHVALFQLLQLRGPNPLFVASVTLSRLDAPAQKATHDKFCMSNFEF